MNKVSTSCGLSIIKDSYRKKPEENLKLYIWQIKKVNLITKFLVGEGVW